uniref:Uncharacterized protein n=1 Tax=Streptomyces avermitilis TaxID=33903 RepID=A0A499W9S2_STRAX|nr:hypothetical protein SAVMC3_89460 [Streptomyces avermitilis]
MAHDEYLRQLTARAKDGTIPQREVKEIARTISEGRAGRDLYRLLYAVARAGGPAYESLVADYLIHPEDPRSRPSPCRCSRGTGEWERSTGSRSSSCWAPRVGPE